MTHIVYGADRRYLAPLLVSMFSLLRATSKRMRITVLTTDPPIEEDAPVLLRLAEIFPRAFIAVQYFDPASLTTFERNTTTRWPAASMTPLLIPWLIRDRCLFLDADTVILDDITELYDTDLCGKPIGACQSPSTALSVRKHQSSGLYSIFAPTRYRRRYRELNEWADCIGFTMEDLKTGYFSSGVLLYDTSAIRRMDSERRLADIERSRPHWGSMPDMDRLNEYFKGQWHPLPLRWNIYRDFNRFNCLHATPALWCEIMTAARNPGLLHYPALFRREPWKRPWYKSRRRHRLYRQICEEIQAATGIDIFELFKI